MATKCCIKNYKRIISRWRRNKKQGKLFLGGLAEIVKAKTETISDEKLVEKNY